MNIGVDELKLYDCGTMTDLIIERVMDGAGKPPSMGYACKKMSYEDFIWFISSVEDKNTPQAIEYWFRCLDIDGDGCISLYELEMFYEQQHLKMMDFRMADVWKFSDFVCALLDLVRPEHGNKIMLSDLKRCECAPLFFDMIFDLKKYDAHVRRADPYFREQDEVFMQVEGRRIQLTGFQKFAAKMYLVLAEEENNGFVNVDEEDSDDPGWARGDDSF